LETFQSGAAALVTRGGYDFAPARSLSLIRATCLNASSAGEGFATLELWSYACSDGRVQISFRDGKVQAAGQ
jgi:hypothetical protein